MNASDMTFGVEIETTIPRGALAVGGYHSGLEVPGFPGWQTMYDGSINTSRGRVACEFVSPVLKGAEGVASLRAMVAYIQSIGGRVNASCGLHVHVGFDKSNAAACVKLATLVANFETAIYASTGTTGREQSRWCRPVQSYGNADVALSAARANRYHVCNFATTHQTIEIRAFAGTLNIQKILAHVYMTVGLVERALKAQRVTNWAAKPVSPTSPISRKGGAGQTALTRLFYQLGWIKGRTDYTYGNVDSVEPRQMRTIKRTLMKLARKYDARS